jgi:hypothetical protein
MQSMKNGSFESLQSVKNLERLSRKQSNNQATDQSGTVDFFSHVRANVINEEVFCSDYLQSKTHRPMIERLSVHYSTHPCFISPDANNAKVWRYMDFTKFVSLLDSNALFFPGADRLSDAWEGAHTVENVRQRPTAMAFGEGETVAEMMDGVSRFHRCLRLHTFVSCWQLNDVESAAMWKLYLSHNEGVAVQTTFECLIGSFQSDENEMFEVYVGKVSYLDYEHGVFPEGNTLVPFLHKRRSFEHEHELRAIIQPVSPGGNPLTETDPFADGLLVDVDLRMLIECIYVAPTSEAWFAALVENTTKKYGLGVSVRHSDMVRDPLY